MNRRAMLIPKPRRRREFIPAMDVTGLSYLASKLGSAERRAMREIAERADLIEVGGKRFVLAEVSDATLEALATFEAEGEDLEFEQDCDRSDSEPSLCGRNAIGERTVLVDRELDVA